MTVRILLAAAAMITSAIIGEPRQASAQYAALPVPILVVDIDRALRESAAGAAMREAEVAERAALQERLNAMRLSLEEEEAEMARVRSETPADEFERRVVAFDQRVRAARRTAQEAAAALQARYAAGQRALQTSAQPLLEELMRERGAAIMLDRSEVLMVVDALNVTQTLIERLDSAHPDATGLLPDGLTEPEP